MAVGNITSFDDQGYINFTMTIYVGPNNSAIRNNTEIYCKTVPKYPSITTSTTFSNSAFLIIQGKHVSNIVRVISLIVLVVPLS